MVQNHLSSSQNSTLTLGLYYFIWPSKYIVDFQKKVKTILLVKQIPVQCTREDRERRCFPNKAITLLSTIWSMYEITIRLL